MPALPPFVIETLHDIGGVRNDDDLSWVIGIGLHSVKGSHDFHALICTATLGPTRLRLP
jgi:hypothetical protein